MKKHLNPPQNVAIFNKTAGIYNAAKGSILVGTFLALITEYAILRHILSTHLTAFWQTIPPLLITAAAGAMCIFLAVERIRYGKEASKILIDKEARQLGNAANGIVFVACLAIFGVSVALSYIGTLDTVNTAIKPPALQTTAVTDSSTAAKLQSINGQYSRDSTATAKQWAARITAESKRLQAEINGIQTQIKAGKHWLQPKLKAAQNEKETALNALKAERAAALIRLTESKRVQAELATTAAANELNTIQSANNTAAARYENLLNKAGKVLPVMVLVAIALILFGCYIVEKFKYKSGIKEVILPNEYDLLPSLASEYKEALTSYFSGILRMGAAAIRRRAIPATATVNQTAAELVKLELEKYKEKVLNMGEPDTHQPTARQSDLTASTTDTVLSIPATEFSRNYEKTAYNETLTELLNTYRIHRQRLQVYQKKQSNADGNPATLQAGIEKHTAEIEKVQAELARHGYAVYLNPDTRRIELAKM
ncbi:hypothetical protein C7N43_18045 [Sphingobacteriales bacterium UPWRP_1]|nr:hypothetical protein BVG80_03390 [Sphingobacteriales bacterium TSM_CSM]PSJ75609.1 hypothetical protein C7N43_18045 [Sphingobacteriales bacterium UPWRP_1]